MILVHNAKYNAIMDYDLAIPLNCTIMAVSAAISNNIRIGNRWKTLPNYLIYIFHMRFGL